MLTSISFFRSLWIDTSYEYYEDANIFSIFFTKQSDSFCFYCEHIENILISYVLDQKIITIEILEALDCLHCHLFDTKEAKGNQPPLRLYAIYHEGLDELRIYFVDTVPSKTTLREIEWEEDIFLQEDDNKKIVALLVRNAGNRIVRGFSEEERNNF